MKGSRLKANGKNLCGAATDRARIKVSCANSVFFDISDHDFSIITATGAEPPASVSITGPSTGVTNTRYSFDARVLPLNATLPLTYSWSATNHDVVITSSAALDDTKAFSWHTPGMKVVVVEATNGVETAVVQTHTVHIKDSTPPDPILDERHVFLPIVRQK